MNKNYYVGAAQHRNLISPFYSPCLTGSCVPGSHPSWVITWWTISPALLILIFPLGFRLTCYYYRKAYYRSFWLAPPACAVSDGHGSYSGETRFPLLLQNIHRYFFDILLIFNIILTIDAFEALRQPGIGIGFSVGTAVLLINAALLWLYSLSCHACRHLCGGGVKQFSKPPRPAPALEDPDPAQRQAHAVRLDEPGLRGLRRPLRATGGQRDHPRLRLPFLRGSGHMAEYETHDFDVIVIGAGGAGLRAAIEARSRGLRTALVCKSLLGKAHTVMAEGGVAAALGNVLRKTTGRSTSGTPCAAARCSTTGAWPSSMPRSRPTGCASSRSGAHCSTGPRTG